MARSTALISPSLAPLLATAGSGVAIVPVQAFERWLASLSAHTRRAYTADLANLATRCGVSDHDLVTQLVKAGPAWTNAVLDAWLTEMKSEQLSTATRTRRLSSAKALIRFLRLVGVITWTIDIRSERVEHADMAGPSAEQMRALLVRIDDMPDGEMRARTKALVLLMGVSGLRISESLGITVPDDLDLQQSRIKIIGKGHSAATWVTLPTMVCEALAHWLTRRGIRPGALFTRLDNGESEHQPLHHTSVYRQLMRLGHAIDKKLAVRPHGLRHRAVTAALDATGGDVRRVMKFSRHKSVTTVLRYDDERRGEQIAGEVADLVAKSV